MIKGHKGYIHIILLSVFAFVLLFPTIRIILIGSGQSDNYIEFILSSLPEIITGILVLISFNFFKREQQRFYLTDIIILIYGLSNIIYGMILSKNILLSAYSIRLSYYPILFYFIGRFLFYADKEQSKKVFTFLYYTFGVLGIIGLILYFFLPETMKLFIIKAGGVVNEYMIVRMTSLLWTPVVFGYIISIGGIFAYYRICKENRMTDYILFAIFGICLFYTVSRGPIASFLIGFIFITILNYKKWQKIILTSILIVMLYLINIHLIPQGKELSNWLFYSTIKTIELEDGLTRTELYKRAYASFINKPEGYGLGKAGIVAKRFFTDTDKDVSIYSTDCMYLKVANETGIWGLISFLGLGGLLFVKFLNYFLTNRESFFSLLFIIFIIAYIDSFFHNYMDMYFISYFFWFTTGILVNYIIEK